MFQIACCGRNKLPLEVNEDMLLDSHFGRRNKNIVENMICFQQAAMAFLQRKMEANSSQITMVEGGKWIADSLDKQLVKYIDRLYDVVQCRRNNKVHGVDDEATFAELNKVIQCQVFMRLNEDAR